MVYEVKDKVFFVTGGASGIGAEVVRTLVAEDAKFVAVLDVNEKEGVAFQNALNSKYGEKVKFILGDVTNEDHFINNMKAIHQEKGLDVLINNAGIMDDRWERYKKEIEINLTAMVTGTLHAVKMMRKDKGGNGGTVINVSAVAALTQSPVMPIYWATKSAVLQFSNCIGKYEYYSRTGVRIITFCPDRTDTALVSNIRPNEKFIEDSIQNTLKDYPSQTPELVAKGLVEAYKKGTSGSTWRTRPGKPVADISDKIKRAYSIMSEDD